MSHRFTATFFHCVFSTKDRLPEIREPEKLWAYLYGIARNHRIEVTAIGGVSDHVHMILTPPPTMSIAEVLTKLKANSSRWLREQGGFSGWQEGYAAFTVSPTAVPAVKRYVDHQKEHHAKRDFRAEFEAMLAAAGIKLPVA